MCVFVFDTKIAEIVCFPQDTLTDYLNLPEVSLQHFHTLVSEHVSVSGNIQGDRKPLCSFLNSLLVEFSQLIFNNSLPCTLFSNIKPLVKETIHLWEKTHVTNPINKVNTCTLKQQNTIIIWKRCVLEIYPCSYRQMHSLAYRFDLNYGPWPVTILLTAVIDNFIEKSVKHSVTSSQYKGYELWSLSTKLFPNAKFLCALDCVFWRTNVSGGLRIWRYSALDMYYV
jgi:hypothetical protein